MPSSQSEPDAQSGMRGKNTNIVIRVGLVVFALLVGWGLYLTGWGAASVTGDFSRRSEPGSRGATPANSIDSPDSRLNQATGWAGQGNPAERAADQRTNDERGTEPESSNPDGPSSEKNIVALPGSESSNEDRSLDDAALRRLVVGNWTSHFHGPRDLVVRDDGTATMVSEPEGIGATLFASRLQFEIKWTIEDGRLEFNTTGGTPATKVNLVLKLYGTRRLQKILTLDDTQMILLDVDGVSRDVWQKKGEGLKIED